jgi:hypothetical protein
MFEQQSYDKAAMAQVVETQSRPEPPLFRNYEIRSWGFSPVIYKILAASAVLHIAALVFVAQTNILTMRGCDSPWVGSVCQVVDMAYVSAMVLGTEREFVDEAYDNIDLGEAEITFIDVTNETPPISYPEGYFQIANPVQHQMRLQMAQNPEGTTSFPGYSYTPPSVSAVPDLMQVKPNPPAANPNAFQDDSSSGILKVDNGTPNSGVVASRKGRGGRIRPGSNAAANANTKPGDSAVAGTNSNTNAQGNEPAAQPTDPVAGPDINKRPIVDLGNFVNEKLQKNEVDLQTEFLVNAKGRLDKNGRLDPKTFQWVQAASTDEDMLEVVKRSIEAINVAGYLQYLKDMSGKDFNFQLQQDAENISAVVLSEMESETRARSIKSSLDLVISFAKLRKQGENADQNDKDDLVLLDNAKVEIEGKRVVLKFVVPKTIAHPMIQRKLAEQAAENQKPSGVTPTRPDNNTAIR